MSCKITSYYFHNRTLRLLRLPEGSRTLSGHSFFTTGSILVILLDLNQSSVSSIPSFLPRRPSSFLYTFPSLRPVSYSLTSFKSYRPRTYYLLPPLSLSTPTYLVFPRFCFPQRSDCLPTRSRENSCVSLVTLQNIIPSLSECRVKLFLERTTLSLHLNRHPPVRPSRQTFEDVSRVVPRSLPYFFSSRYLFANSSFQLQE